MSSTQRPTIGRSTRRTVLAVFGLLMLMSCSGEVDGVGSSGTGITTSGIQIGTITGFGSVIVEGNSYDSAAATIQIDRNPTLPTTVGESSLRLGMRVELGFDASERAQTVVTRPEVIGVIQTRSGNTLTVAGQTVRSNAVPGVDTVLEGVESIEDLQAGDRIEVHGVREPATETLVATRIERLDSAGTQVRIAGTASSVANDQRSLVVGGLEVRLANNAVVLPPGAQLANGQRVTVWSASGLNAGGTLSAQAIRVDPEPTPGGAAQPLRTAGIVRQLATGQSSFVVGQRQVIYSAGTRFIGGAATDLANGAAVAVRGTLQGAQLVASEIRLQRQASDRKVVVEGAVSNFVSLASLLVRNTRIDASGATIVFSGGTAGQIQSGAVIRVEGSVVDDVLVPTMITIRSAAIASDTVQTEGVVAAVFPALRTFRVNGVNVVLSDATVVDGNLTDLRLGAQVRVTGPVGSAPLQAATLRVRPRE
jgi:hypothetical protein